MSLQLKSVTHLITKVFRRVNFSTRPLCRMTPSLRSLLKLKSQDRCMLMSSEISWRGSVQMPNTSQVCFHLMQDFLLKKFGLLILPNRATRAWSTMNFWETTRSEFSLQKWHAMPKTVFAGPTLSTSWWPQTRWSMFTVRVYARQLISQMYQRAKSTVCFHWERFCKKQIQTTG